MNCIKKSINNQDSSNIDGEEVNLSLPVQDGQILVYNNGQFQNETPAAAVADNIYNKDDAIDSNRVVTLNNFNLQFTGNNGTQIDLNPASSTVTLAGDTLNANCDTINLNAPSFIGGTTQTFDFSSNLLLDLTGPDGGIKADGVYLGLQLESSSPILCSNRVTSPFDPLTPDQLTRKSYVDGLVSNADNVYNTNGTLTGNRDINCNGNSLVISNANPLLLESTLSNISVSDGITLTSSLNTVDVAGSKIVNVSNPTNLQDAVTLDYFNNNIPPADQTIYNSNGNLNSLRTISGGASQNGLVFTNMSSVTFSSIPKINLTNMLISNNSAFNLTVSDAPVLSSNSIRLATPSTNQLSDSGIIASTCDNFSIIASTVTNIDSPTINMSAGVNINTTQAIFSNDLTLTQQVSGSNRIAFYNPSGTFISADNTFVYARASISEAGTFAFPQQTVVAAVAGVPFLLGNATQTNFVSNSGLFSLVNTNPMTVQYTGTNSIGAVIRFGGSFSFSDEDDEIPNFIRFRRNASPSINFVQFGLGKKGQYEAFTFEEYRVINQNDVFDLQTQVDQNRTFVYRNVFMSISAMGIIGL